jgi:hypothetical protein
LRFARNAPAAAVSVSRCGETMVWSTIVLREDLIHSTPLVDIAGRRRSPATISGFHQGRPPRNKVLRYPADPPTVEEIIAVMRAAGDDTDGIRLRGLIVVLWRAGLPAKHSVWPRATSMRTEARFLSVMATAASVARSGWTVGAGSNWHRGSRSAPSCQSELSCVLRGPTRGRPWAPAGVRAQLHELAARAGV